LKARQRKPKWNANEHLATTRYKMLVPYDNVGEYRLVGNDVQSLFQDLFNKQIISIGR
jgi:hypothetical protein